MNFLPVKFPLLIILFNHPECCDDLTELEWDLVIRQARVANLLARLGWFLKKKGRSEAVPTFAKRHLDSEDFVCQAVKRSAFWEAERIYEALKPLNIKVLLVKGAAYSLMGLDAANGRIYQDTDIIVSKDALNNVERMLMWHGWIDRETDEYEQLYYRTWMHELPPKYHNKRGTVLDVHHNILPETCKLCPDIALILETAVQIPATDYWLPSHEDLVIHSATHLFHEGEYGNGLRDISDLNLLLTEFSEQTDFWNKLVERSNTLKLGRPLFYALRYTKIIFQTKIPDNVINRVNKNRPFSLLLMVMDFLFIRALMPDHSSCNDRWTGLARFLLYIRSHWLRMPLNLLIPHLLRKSWLRFTGETTH